MALMRPHVKLHRLGIYGIIVLAVCLVGTVIVVIRTDDTWVSANGSFPEPVILDPEKQPLFVFPDELRTYDLSLNRFIDRFFRICAEGKYSEFRLMLSSRVGDPVLPKRFESMFNALKEARIQSIQQLPPLPSLDGPLYVLTAEYDLEGYATQNRKTGNLVRLAIAKEEGAWRIGPIPRELLAIQQKSQPIASQPPAPGESSVAQSVKANPSKTPASDLPRARANRPARIPPS